MKHPLQKAHIRLVTTKNGLSEKPAPESSPCPILEQCGVCEILPLPYKEQLVQKTNHFKNMLLTSGLKTSAGVRPCLAAPEHFHYRHAIKVSLGQHFDLNQRHWIDVGFYRKYQNKVVDIGRCPVQKQSINQTLALLRTGIRQNGISIWTPKNPNGLLHSATVKFSTYTGENFVILHTTKDDKDACKPLARHLVTDNRDTKAVFMLAEGSLSQVPVLIAGQGILREKYGDFIFQLPMDVQIPQSPLLIQLMALRILELLDLSSGQESLVHLNCGFGLYPLLLSSHLGRILAFEGSAAELACGQENASLLKIQNVTFKKLSTQDHLSAEVPAHVSWNGALVQGLRSSLPLHHIQELCALNPRVIVYISSHVETLTADIQTFQKEGYSPLAFELFDSFPGTRLYESLCLLQK